MELKLRYFTQKEAESLIPKISKCLASAREIQQQIEVKISEWREDKDDLKPHQEALLRSQVDFLTAQLEDHLGEISKMGSIPKNLGLGLVDFATRIDGREAYLCWKMGEKKITHWHGLTDGYKGRKKLKK